MHPALLVGAGFLLGTAGMKVVKSKPVHNLCVKSIACGMKVRDDVTTMVDEARMQFDDLMAEASYEHAVSECACGEADVIDEEIVVVEEAADEPAKASKPTKSTKKA